MKTELNRDSRVIIESERDAAGYDYLVKVWGKEAVETAVDYLAGNRRPYVSNIAKLMHTTIPVALQREQLPVSTEKAQDFIQKIKEMIKVREDDRAKIRG